MAKKTKRAKHARSTATRVQPDEVQILDQPPTQEDLAEALQQARDQLGDPSKLSDDEILQLHRGAEHELELMAARSRSYALRAYAMGLALAARKKTIKWGDYTRWVEETLGLPRTTAGRYKLVYERLTALAAQTDQYWSVSLLDLPVDRLEKHLRAALPPAKKRKKAEPRESGDGKDAEDRDPAEDRQAEAGASTDGARTHGGEETEVDPEHATARVDEEGGESDDGTDDAGDDDGAEPADDEDAQEDADEHEAEDAEADESDDEQEPEDVEDDLLEDYPQATEFSSSALTGTYDVEHMEADELRALGPHVTKADEALKGLAERHADIKARLRSRTEQLRHRALKARRTA